MDKNFDLIITNALLNEYQEAVHIAVKNGRISELVNPNDVDTEVREVCWLKKSMMPTTSLFAQDFTKAIFT